MTGARTNVALGVAAVLVATSAVTVALARQDAAAHRVVAAQAAVGYRLHDTQPPGTPLPGGLHVPVGMRLVGTVFPDVSGGRPAGWTASFVLTGDPAAAFDDVLRTVSAVAPYGRARCLDATVARRIRNASCSVEARNRQQLIDWSLGYGVEAHGQPPAPTAGSLLLVYPHQPPRRPHRPRLIPIEPVFPSLTAPFAAPPDTGAVVDGFTDFGGTLRIVPGSEAVTRPIGSQLIVRVTGDRTAVFKAYVAQLASREGARRTATGHSRFGEWRSFTLDADHTVGNAYLLMVTNHTGTYLQIRLI